MPGLKPMRTSPDWQIISRSEIPGIPADRIATMHRNHPHEAPFARMEVEIEKLVYGGEGLGRHQGKVVFVPFTVPGDRVEVRPVERRKGFIRATVTEILQPGVGRQDPPCPHFGKCGGCQWQHLDYALQVETKRRILEGLFHHHFPETRKLSIGMKACPQPFGYRSRARVQLRGAGAQAKVGFFRHRSNIVEDVEVCPLFRPPLNEALTRVRRAQIEGRFGPGDNELELACAEDGRWVFAAAEPVEPASGQPQQDLLLRHAGEFVYAASASVFFQANDFMLPELIAAVTGLGGGGNSAVDLFSGVGLFSLPLARRYGRVVAVEGNPEAHRLCVRNASCAGLENIEAVCADVAEWMAALSVVAPPAFDLIVLDPPRSGAGQEVMKRIAEWAAETVVYVSCDPQTLTRDLAVLSPRHYQIDTIEGFDLFPQTYHIETVVGLKRR
jgi:23S rRNA (uracil1939-C5)-methyltransferase